VRAKFFAFFDTSFTAVITVAFMSFLAYSYAATVCKAMLAFVVAVNVPMAPMAFAPIPAAAAVSIPGITNTPLKK